MLIGSVEWMRSLLMNRVHVVLFTCHCH